MDVWGAGASAGVFDSSSVLTSGSCLGAVAGLESLALESVLCELCFRFVPRGCGVAGAGESSAVVCALLLLLRPASLLAFLCSEGVEAVAVAGVGGGSIPVVTLGSV